MGFFEGGRPSVVVFDLDGTLVDTLEDITTLLGQALRTHGHEPPRGTSSMVGDGARTLVARALAATAGPSDDIHVEAVLDTYLALYRADPTPSTKPMPGAIALLDALDGAGVPAVVCTNKPQEVAEQVVERVLPGRLRGVVGARPGLRLKPQPDAVLCALSLVGADPSDAWMVGDGPQDVLAARASSVRSVAYRGGYGSSAQLAAASADLYVDRLEDLVARVRRAE